jgi:hypothetical protein
MYSELLSAYESNYDAVSILVHYYQDIYALDAPPVVEFNIQAIFAPMLQELRATLLGILWQIAPYGFGILAVVIALEFGKGFIYESIMGRPMGTTALHEYGSLEHESEYTEGEVLSGDGYGNFEQCSYWSEEVTIGGEIDADLDVIQQYDD